MAGFYRLRADGADLAVRLTPRAAREGIDGVGGGAGGQVHLKVRVRAIPEKGAANAALETLIARALALPPSAVAVVAGGTSRLKTVRVSADPAALARALPALAGTG